MYQRVSAYVLNEHMLDKSDKVIIGVSGGADSICLLFMLLKLKQEIGFSIVAVHVHHGLRGKAADRDAAFVQQICREWDTELELYYRDMRALSKEWKMTLEEAGREARRAVMLEAKERFRGTKIALAHHQNDNVETLILNLCRGTGLRGLGGMAPVSGAFIRPLLCLKREEIESYLKELGISYCTDETNLEDAYTRNRIRHHIVPYLEQEINDQAVRHMAETMEQMQSLAAYVKEQTRKWTTVCVRERSGKEVVLLKEEYRKIPVELRPFVVLEILCRAAGKQKDIESSHAKCVESLMEKQVGRRLDLPYRITARRCYEGIVFEKKGGTGEKYVEHEAEVLPGMNYRIIEKTSGNVTFPKTPYTKWFDYDIIKNTVKMRHREPGDYLTIDKLGRTQKLKQYFINEKIPQEKRDQIWLIADGHHIMWVVGYRQNQLYQVTDGTNQILEIEINGGKNDGRDC